MQPSSGPFQKRSSHFLTSHSFPDVLQSDFQVLLPWTIAPKVTPGFIFVSVSSLHPCSTWHRGHFPLPAPVPRQVLFSPKYSPHLLDVTIPHEPYTIPNSSPSPRDFFLSHLSVGNYQNCRFSQSSPSFHTCTINSLLHSSTYVHKNLDIPFNKHFPPWRIHSLQRIHLDCSICTKDSKPRPRLSSSGGKLTQSKQMSSPEKWI